MGSRRDSNRDGRSTRILFVCDATKYHGIHEFRHSIHNVRMQADIVNSGDTIVVFGALHRILHPSKFLHCEL